MRPFFAAALGVLLLLSLVAWRIEPRPPAGKTPLVWVSDDNPARRGQIALFNKLYPQYDLRLDPNDTSGREKVILQCLAGVGPDLFDSYSPSELDSYVRSGIAWDITDELAKRGIDMNGTVWPAILPTGVREGRVYGFPANVAVDAIWYNKDLFDAASEPYPKGPWTWDEFIEVAKRLTLRDERGRVKQFGFFCDWWQWPQFIMLFGGRLYSDDGTRSAVDSPEAVAAIQFMYDLMYKYKVMPNPVAEAAMATQGGWGSGTITYFGAGKGAMALGGRWWLCTLRDYEGLNLGVVEIPYDKRPIYRAYGRSTCINRYSPNREQALDFLLYEAGKPYNDLINQQADAVASVIRYNYTPEFLHNPQHPEEDYNEVWREVVKYGQSDDWSPFVNGQTASRIIDKQLDLVRNDQKSAREALRDAARLVNEEIAKTLEMDPSLRIKYYRLTGREGPE
ncbi:MAG: sugar ABC transporter substrate-binding protein [Armatimonadota bacterium]